MSTPVSCVRGAEYNRAAAAQINQANVAIDPDAGLINRGSRANHDNLDNNPFAPRSQAITYEELPPYPAGFPQGYSQALLNKKMQKPNMPTQEDKARHNFVHTLGQPSAVHSATPEANPFSSRLFARPGTAGRPGSPQRYHMDGDSIFASRA